MSNNSCQERTNYKTTITTITTKEENKMSNLTNKKLTTTNKSTRKTNLAAACYLTAIGTIMFAEPALAGFDLNKLAKAVLDPVVGLITEYYGIGIAVGGVAGVLVGQGADPRSRVINAGIGAGLSSGMILGLLKAFT